MVEHQLTASTDQTLAAENAELRARVEDLEDALRAIRKAEVDALVAVDRNDGIADLR